MNTSAPSSRRLATRLFASRLLASSALLCTLAHAALPQTPAQVAAPPSQTPATPTVQQPAPQMKFTRHRFVEPNTLAPELYADKLSIKLTLVDLPGASDPRSTWEGNYKLYFISEAEMRKVEGEVVRRKSAESGGGARSFGWNPSPADFPSKILIAEGSILKKNLATPQQRVHLQENVAFKEKVPAELRTKAGRLLIAYSVKVFDAKLNAPVYDSGVFLMFPFDDLTDPDKTLPRAFVYTNFIVTPKGDIWESQLPRKDGDTNWM